MPIVQTSGSQTAVIGTEHILADFTTPVATYQLLVDISAMVAGDNTELRIYTRIRSGDGLNSGLYQLYQNAPTGNGDQIAMSPPVMSDQEIKFTLKQTAGTGRAYPWKVITF